MNAARTHYFLPFLVFIGVLLMQQTQQAGTAQQQEKSAVVNKIGGLGKIENFSDTQRVTVQTNMAAFDINLQGGAVTGASLAAFPSTLNSQEALKMLSDDPEHLYVLQAGVSGDADLTYTCDQDGYQLSAEDNQVSVMLRARDANGRVFEKVFTFFRDKYFFNVQTTVHNNADSAWEGMHYARILLRHDAMQQTPAKNIFVHKDDQAKNWLTFNTYAGPAYFSDNKPYVKMPFTEVEKKAVTREVDKPGWIAMQQRYFISALIPQNAGKQTLTATWQSGVAGEENEHARSLFKFSTIGSKLKLAPGQSSSQTTVIYTGPEDVDRLSVLAQGLELTVDYGWLWFISDILFRGLVFIHAYLGSWGLSIIAITILVKVAFYKLSAASYTAVAKQKKLQPKIEEVNRKYSDNPEQKSKAMLALYQKEGVNPLSGCLPTLLQMPFFIALYYVLIESVQLRFQPFLWLPDLSASDPFFILPVLFCLSMLGMQKISPVAQTDESQANAMFAMPFVASILFAQMPSGLLLYWITNNTLSILQQWHVTKNQ